MKVDKGIASSMAVIAIVSVSTITTAFGVGIGMLESTFLGVNQQSEGEFLREVLKENVQAACKGDSVNDIPANGNFTVEFNSYDQLRIHKKDAVASGGSYRMNMYKEGEKVDQIKLDGDGAVLHGWSCSETTDHDYGRIHFSVGGPHNPVKKKTKVKVNGTVKMRIVQSEIGQDDDPDDLHDLGDDDIREDLARIIVRNEVN